MSLVAYADSSDEASNCSDGEEAPTTSARATATLTAPKVNGNALNGGISDDDEDYTPTDYVPLTDVEKKPLTLSLPKPKHMATAANTPDEVLDKQVTPTFAKLPMPKQTRSGNVIIEEEDDEFVHKKATAPIDGAAEKPPPPPTITAKGPVKITIPSLKDFSDVEQDLAGKTKSKAATPASQKKSGLLSILPMAKSEQNFAKTSTSTIAPPVAVNVSTKQESTAAKATATLSTKGSVFIPDTVKNCRPAHNTEGVDGVKHTAKKITKICSSNKPKISLLDCSDSEGSDEESATGGDFFSLNAEEKLPEVSTIEINAMVAQRAAKMANAATQYLNAAVAKPQDNEQMQLDEEMLQAQKRYHDSQLDQAAVQALVGSSAKRRRKEREIQVLDISSEQVLPNRDEWMRTALASSTAYQPTGVLVDEEPVAGTRRKHQITYLAHKAKANEAELQAMWATNRQNRRATQSKYGF